MSVVAGAGPVSGNDDTAWFFEGTARGEFLLRRCPQGHWNRPQAARCAECDSTELVPAAASGRGRLISWAVVHPRPGTDNPPPPSVPAIVELDEGPWWWTIVVGRDPAVLKAGMELALAFERPEGSETVPVWTVAGG